MRATELQRAICAHACIIETGSVEDVLRYLREGRPEAACEILDGSGHLHYACMSPGRGDALFELADRIREGER